MKKLLVLMLSVVMVAGVIGGCGNKQKDTEKDNTPIKSEKEEIKETTKDWKNTIIEGVEYIDVSRNFSDLSREKTSFYIDKEKTKVVTYINENEDKKLQLKYLYSDDQCYAVFSTETEFKTKNNTSIIVSDENYTGKNGPLVTETKELVYEKDGAKGYSEKSGNYYSYYFVKNIEDIDVYLYANSYTEKDENLYALIEELVGYLSVNDEVGFLQDWELNTNYVHTFDNKGVVLKSAKTLTKLAYPGSGQDTDLIKMGDHKFEGWFRMSDYRGDEVDKELVTYDTLGKYTIGYKVYDSSYSKYFYVYVYTSETNEAGIEVYDEVVVFELNNYDGVTSQEELTKAVVNNLILCEIKGE